MKYPREVLETNAYITLEPRRERTLNPIPIELPDQGKEYRGQEKEREPKTKWLKAVRQGNNVNIFKMLK